MGSQKQIQPECPAAQMLINPAFVNTPLVTGMGSEKLLPDSRSNLISIRVRCS